MPHEPDAEGVRRRQQLDELVRADVKDGGRDVLAGLLAAQDPQLMQWCNEAAGHLRNAVRMIENLLDPDTIVIGGSAPRAFLEHLVSVAMPLQGSVRGSAAASAGRILLSERDEDSSILGAAVLPIFEMLSPRFEMLLQERRGQSRVEGLLGRRPATGAGRL